MSKVVNLLRTGRAGGKKPSEQDQKIDALFFKVRYQYTGNDSPQRQFCRAMMRSQKVYRKEDIIALSNQPANPGFGEFGADTYSIWLHKGGARCKHKWRRRTYVSTRKIESIGGPKTNEITEAVAERYGYVVNDPTWADASTEPYKTTTKGFSPNNPNTAKYWQK